MDSMPRIQMARREVTFATPRESGGRTGRIGVVVIVLSIAGSYSVISAAAILSLIL